MGVGARSKLRRCGNGSHGSIVQDVCSAVISVGKPRSTREPVLARKELAPSSPLPVVWIAAIAVPVIKQHHCAILKGIHPIEAPKHFDRRLIEVAVKVYNGSL